MIAKFNSKRDIQAKGIFHPPEIHWLTNLDDSLHLHIDTTQACCQNALTKVESLNTRTLSKTGPSTLEAYRQQWPHEDPWEMPSPFIGHNDPYYANHDPKTDVDEEWFQ